MSPEMKQDLIWWSHILDSPALNGVPLSYFGDLPSPAVIIEIDASDDGLCDLEANERRVLRYRFSPEERRLIQLTKTVPLTGFGINYRELLSCAFAAQAWGNHWASRRAGAPTEPVHVQFRIDNTSAVAWQNKMGSRNKRAQTIIHLLSHWELAHGLQFSSCHVADVDNRIADAGNTRIGRCLIEEDLAFHLRAHSVADSTCVKYKRALKMWVSWTTSHGIQPALINFALELRLHFVTVFIIHGLQVGYGSGRRVRSSTIASMLHGISHFFHVAALQFSSNHPHIRMDLKGISRLDGPVSQKAPVSLQLLESCYHLLDLSTPFGQAFWGVLCMAFFFLLRHSKIAAKGSKFAWFVLKASYIAVLDATGSITRSARLATTVHIRLAGSKTNQQGIPTQRLLNRSGHPFLCPVFGALCMLKARSNLPVEIPAAVFVNEKGKPGCITGEAITAVIRRVAVAHGIKPDDYSTHSLRSGGATHMYRAGVVALTIQFNGRWASDTFKQYTRLCRQSVNGLAARIVSGQKQVQNLQ